MQSFNLHTKRIKSGIPNAAQLTESTAQIQTINQILCTSTTNFYSELQQQLSENRKNKANLYGSHCTSF